uniref:Uncharacterized protein n=1 Tax=Phaeomonas parva TaxID=124430 RepID=A0A7S1UDA8_9STRA
MLLLLKPPAEEVAGAPPVQDEHAHVVAIKYVPQVARPRDVELVELLGRKEDVAAVRCAQAPPQLGDGPEARLAAAAPVAKRKRLGGRVGQGCRRVHPHERLCDASEVLF